MKLITNYQLYKQVAGHEWIFQFDSQNRFDLTDYIEANAGSGTYKIEEVFVKTLD